MAVQRFWTQSPASSRHNIFFTPKNKKMKTKTPKTKLHLVLKKQWFDMIASGEKMEEYREIKKHNMSMLIDTSGVPAENKADKKRSTIFENMLFDRKKHHWPGILKAHHCKFRKFDTVVFQHGYASNAPQITFKCEGLSIGSAKPEWSDNWKGDVFVIKIGDRLNA